jgi:hypothetical protein
MNIQGQKPVCRTGRLKITTWLLGLMLMVNFSASGQSLTIHDENSYNSKLSSGKHRTTKITFGGLKSFDVEYRGEIEVNATDTDITSIAPGGYFEVSKTTFGSKRSIVIEPSAGKLVKEYYEGRSKVAWEPEGRKWLEEILPDLVRSTGIAAKSRINRYFKEGGVNAVMNEISRLESSYVQSIYGKLLFQKPGLTDNDLISAISQLSRDISSSYYLSQLLEDTSDKFLSKENTREAYFDAVAKIDSDYYKSQVLRKAFTGTSPSDAVMSKIMYATSEIGSDYYQSEVLSELLSMRNLSPNALDQIIKATGSIGSDYYQSQVLSKAMKKDELSAEAFNSLMENVSEIGSDYYMSQVFSDMLDSRMEEKTLTNMIKLLNRNMDSDYYLSSVLSKMMREQKIEANTMAALSEAIADMSSSTYAAEIIKDASRADRIEKNTLIALLQAAGEIDSDYYLSEALTSLADHVRASDDEVKKAYREAARKIGSDTYYGRAVKAID